MAGQVKSLDIYNLYHFILLNIIIFNAYMLHFMASLSVKDNRNRQVTFKCYCWNSQKCDKLFSTSMQSS